MLCLRAVALYDHVNWVKCTLWVSLALSYIATFALLGPTYKSVWKDVVYFPLTNICLFPVIPSYVSVAYLGSTPFEVLVSILIVIKAYQNMTTLRSRSDTPIVRIPLYMFSLWSPFSLSPIVIRNDSRQPPVSDMPPINIEPKVLTYKRHSHFLIIVCRISIHLLRNSRFSDYAPPSDLGHVDCISSNHGISGGSCKLGFWISVNLFIDASRS